MLLNIFKIISKSFLATLVIGYFIFNLVYIMNDCPTLKNNILTSCSVRDIPTDDSKKNFIFDQGKIASSYYTWLSKAILLDFGQLNKKRSSKIFPLAVKHFIKSFKLIFISIIIGFILSFFIYKISLHQKIKKIFIDPLLSISFLHLCIFIISFKYIIYSVDSGIISDLIVCLIMILSNGILYDFFCLLKGEHDLVTNKDYVIFSKHSGFSLYTFASKELVISFIYITVSRIPVLFASMTILEVILENRYWGVGKDIWFYFYLSPNYAAFFGSTFITVLFFTLLYFISEHLKNSLSPKLNKT